MNESASEVFLKVLHKIVWPLQIGVIITVISIMASTLPTMGATSELKILVPSSPSFEIRSNLYSIWSACVVALNVMAIAVLAQLLRLTAIKLLRNKKQNLARVFLNSSILTACLHTPLHIMLTGAAFASGVSRALRQEVEGKIPYFGASLFGIQPRIFEIGTDTFALIGFMALFIPILILELCALNAKKDRISIVALRQSYARILHSKQF